MASYTECPKHLMFKLVFSSFCEKEQMLTKHNCIFLGQGTEMQGKSYSVIEAIKKSTEHKMTQRHWLTVLVVDEFLLISYCQLTTDEVDINFLSLFSGHINLGKKGYRVPLKGTIQVSMLLNFFSLITDVLRQIGVECLSLTSLFNQVQYLRVRPAQVRQQKFVRSLKTFLAISCRVCFACKH